VVSKTRAVLFTNRRTGEKSGSWDFFDLATNDVKTAFF